MFGCDVYVIITGAHRRKVYSKCKRIFFLDTQTWGIGLWILIPEEFFVSRNVRFKEGKILVINFQKVWPSRCCKNLSRSVEDMDALIRRVNTFHYLDLKFRASQYFNGK